MTVQRLLCKLCVLSMSAVIPLCPAGESALAVQTEPVLPQPATPQLVSSFGKLPLSFEANHGQTDAQVKFLTRGLGYTLFLTPTEAVMVLQHREAKEQGGDKGVRDPLSVTEPAPIKQSVVRMKLEGANPSPAIEGIEQLPGIVNYFVGNDSSKWRTNIPTYKKVEYKEVYPGIDLAYYGNQGKLEYDLIVAPGADPNQIKLAFDGAEKIEVDSASGDLVLTLSERAAISDQSSAPSANHQITNSPTHQLRLQKPLVYQLDDKGHRTLVAGNYVLQASNASRVTHQSSLDSGPSPISSEPPQLRTQNSELNTVTIHLAAYDLGRRLVIDPTLMYSTYLGGSASEEGGNGIAVDTAGAAYVTGGTRSADFTASCTAPCLVLDSTLGGVQDAFVTKVNPTGTALLYTTYLGGAPSIRALTSPWMPRARPMSQVPRFRLISPPAARPRVWCWIVR